MTHRKLCHRWAMLFMVLIFGSLMSVAQAQDSAGRGLGRDAGTSKRLALVIGNDAYQKVDPLKNAGNDAKLMAATLKKAGFEVTQAGDLGRDGMWRSIDTFKSRINKGDEVVFYYAGHGVQINSNQLLLPTDISAVNDAQVQRDAVSLLEVQDALKDARFALLVIDACRDNPFPKTAGRSIGGGTRGLMPPEPVTGQVIMMSAGRNQKALDNVPGESQANGLFTWELTKAINTPGVEIRVALENVKDRVDDKAKTIGHEQRPGMVSDLRGNFYFFGSTTVQVQGGTPIADPETETWAAAQRANSLTGYQAFMDAYPKSHYGVAAKIAIDALKRPPAQTTATKPVASTPAASTDPETQFWNEVKASAAREYLDTYLKQYPKGKYLTLAKVELKKFDDLDKASQARAQAEAQMAQEREPQEEQRAEQAAWDDTKTLNTVSAYTAYLSRYPQGRYITLAYPTQQRLQREEAQKAEQLAAQLKQQQAEAALREEQDAWGMVEASTDSDVVQRFLDRYPAGSNEGLAQTKLAQIKRAEAEMRPGKVFKDCADCPDMVVLPAGSGITVMAMGQAEVTQEQWQAVMGNNPSNFQQCGRDCPVEQVSWDDVLVFIQKLNAKTGKTYRLPTEQEWGHACLGGQLTEYCGGINVDAVAWYGDNSASTTRRVRTKQANGFGLYDMSGNVWEWTDSCWEGNCGQRVLRGGSWGGEAEGTRAAVRDGDFTSGRGYYLGLRLARRLP